MSDNRPEMTDNGLAANGCHPLPSCSTFLVSLARLAGVDITVKTPVEIYFDAKENLCVNFVKSNTPRSGSERPSGANGSEVEHAD